MDSAIRSIIKVMKFPLNNLCKAYNKTSFFSVGIFPRICSMVSGSMEIVKENNYVMVGYQWRVESGDGHTVKKAS